MTVLDERALPALDELTTAYDVLQLSYDTAFRLFGTLPAPSVEEMDGEYRAEMLDQGSRLWTLASLLVVNVPGRWIAKAFAPTEGDEGAGYNAFVRGEQIVRDVRMRTYVGPSTYDGRAAYHLDYSAYNRGPVGTMHDEIRKLSGDLYLGIAEFGWSPIRRRTAFLLQGPVAPLAR